MVSLERKKYNFKFWSRFYLIFSIFLLFLIFVINFLIVKNHNNHSELDKKNDEINQAITNFKETSDYLTNQVRFFVIKKDRIYMDAFCYEVYIFRRRESFKYIILKNNDDAILSENFNLAYEKSKELNKMEFYIIKLTCEALNITEEIPDFIQEIELTEEDKNLSSNEKLTKAQELVFSDEYSSLKKDIRKYISISHAASVNFFTERENNSISKLNMLFVINAILFFALILEIFLFSIFLAIVYNETEKNNKNS